MATVDYRDILISEFQQRKSRNPMYSLRAFARDLGVGNTTLSDTLARRRHLSRKSALRISERLSFSPQQRERLLLEIRNKNDAEADDFPLIQLAEDEFRLISDWYYFAILSLARLKNNRFTPDWVARRLGIEPMQAQDALSRLTRLGYIVKESGKIVRTAAPIRSTSDVPSSALRSHHRQNLRRAEQALNDVPVEFREISSITFATSRARLAEAKEMIVRFRRTLSKKLSDEAPDDVYTLAIQLFPATTLKKRRTK